MRNTNLRHIFPGWLKRPLKDALFKYQLRNAIRQITSADGAIPSRQLLSQLMDAWGNEGYAAKLDYLEAVARFSTETHGPILECGSGATTLLLGVLSAKRKIEVWSLEHSLEWKTVIDQALARNTIMQVHVSWSPLIDYGEFIWYQAPLDQMPKEFSLVVCDGPPGSTRGGRYGLLPVMGDRLPSGSTILLDDANRPGELELIERWQREAEFETELKGTLAHQYAVMRRCGANEPDFNARE